MTQRASSHRRSGDPPADIAVRPTEPGDFHAIIDMARRIYPEDVPYTPAELTSQRDIFPEGQMVAIERPTGRVAGMAASLIVNWDDYEVDTSWLDFTDEGRFTNHNPRGKTLYGADIMVHPDMQGRGVGKAIYAARRQLCRDLKLKRIRAGARLVGYGRHADQMTPVEYALQVVQRRITDPTLTFQLKQRFRVIGVVTDYLEDDPASRGAAAVIEWLNHRAAKPKDYAMRDPRFAKHFPQHPPRST